jgi:putative sterol carrier protein
MQTPDQTLSLGELLKSIPQNASPQQIKGIDAVVQFRSLGTEPGEWIITVKDGTCTYVVGTAASPTLTLEASSDVWMSLVQRKLDPGWAYMSGQLHISGDIGLAMRLQSLLSFS